jgi:hypothetical protein
MTYKEFNNLKIGNKVKIKEGALKDLVGCIEKVIGIRGSTVELELENGLRPVDIFPYTARETWSVSDYDYRLLEKVSSWSYERDY